MSKKQDKLTEEKPKPTDTSTQSTPGDKPKLPGGGG